MDINPIIERVRAGGLGLKSVGGATGLADALEGKPTLYPAAFVVVPSEAAERNTVVGRHRQRVTSRVSIVVGVKAAAAKAMAPADEVTALRLAVVRLIASWKAPDADTAFDFVSSTVRAIDEGMVWCEITFEAKWMLTIAA